MIKDYIKEFDTNSEYQSYIAGDPVLPNVSYIVETNGVAFNPYVPPQPIRYTASEKLTKTWSNETTTFGATIKSHTFENGVGTIEFDGDVTSISDGAFSGCIEITSVVIPNSVTIIGNAAFNRCFGLTSVTIPNSVTTIGHGAFGNCTGLTSITIPNTVTSISGSAFYGCIEITSIVVDSANTVYDSRNNCNAIINTSTNELIAGCKNTVIPNTVTSIGEGAFSGCSVLTSVTIPSGVTSIGTSVFSQCTNLTSVIIGSGVTNIGSSAFSGCSSLTSITSNATTAPTIQSRTFYGVKTGGTLTVPNGSSGYDNWMATGNYYLGKYSWTKTEQ